MREKLFGKKKDKMVEEKIKANNFELYVKLMIRNNENILQPE
jgi:hypothetical protein